MKYFIFHTNHWFVFEIFELKKGKKKLKKKVGKYEQLNAKDY